MKKLIVSIILLLSLLVIGFPKSTLADEVFDSYESNIPWNEQRAHLDNFAYFLKKHSEVNGYIIFNIGGKDSFKKIKSHVDRSKKYLIQNGKIEKSRLIVIKADTKREKSEVILQPILKGTAPPNFD